MNKGRGVETEMSFLEHLEELRWHIVKSLVAIVLVAILAFIFKGIVFDLILIAPKTPDFLTNRVLCHYGEVLNMPSLCINSVPFQLISIKMSGQFSTHIMVSFFTGLIVAFPYVFFQFWKFISPALYENEKKHTRGAVFFSSFLFLSGVLFGYFIIAPLSVHFLGSYHVSGQVTNQINLNSYIGTVVSCVLASGVVFELPIVVFFLSKAGIVTPAGMKKYRKHSIVAILALSAIITPPDVFSQLLVCMPLILLYEISIIISRSVEKKAEEQK